MTSTACRSLKVESDGDFFRGKTVPKIRLRGKWLAAAGFPQGGRVTVSAIAPGIIQLIHETQSQAS